MSKHNIVADPSTIVALGRSLYSNRIDFVITRELLQNAIDASGIDDRILVDVSWIDSNIFEITVDDIGIGMTEDILLNVFLTIGGTFKVGGNTGGFGIAKLALFTADEWSVHTLDNYIDHTLEHKKIEHRQGTRVCARYNFDGGTQDYHKSRIERLIHSNISRNIIYNGESVKSYDDARIIDKIILDNGIEFVAKLSEVGLQNQYSWGAVDFGYTIYRINGLTQFVSFNGDLSQAERNMVIDFSNIGYKPKDDNYPFTLSREGVKDERVTKYVSSWLSELAKDILSKISHAEENKELKTEWINPNTGLIARSSDGKLYKPDLLDRQIANIWKNIVTAIKPEINWQIAVTNDSRKTAFYHHPNTYQFIIGINPSVVYNDLYLHFAQKNTTAILLYLWHLAIHEISHYYVSEHNEEFTRTEGTIALSSLDVITDDKVMANIKRLIRKITNTN